MRIALVRAVSVAMAPVHEAVARLWPEAECAALLRNGSLPSPPFGPKRAILVQLTRRVRRRPGGRCHR